MEKLTTALAEKFTQAFQSDEVKDLIESTEKAAKNDTGTFEVVITTENVDRYNEVVMLGGWDIENYLKNAVVLWGHDHSKIIGVATELRFEDGKLIAKGKFAPTEEGQEKRKLYEEGFLKATSVGFIEKEREGNVITKAELIEFSFVSVPANPYALSLAIEHERSIDELVTKGIFTVETKDGEPEPDPEPEPEPRDPVTLTFSAEQERALAASIAASIGVVVADTIKKELGALEVAKDGEPEGTDDSDNEEEEDEEVRAYRVKRALQTAATLVGEELAERRRAQ